MSNKYSCGYFSHLAQLGSKRSESLVGRARNNAQTHVSGVDLCHFLPTPLCPRYALLMRHDPSSIDKCVTYSNWCSHLFRPFLHKLECWAILRTRSIHSCGCFPHSAQLGSHYVSNLVGVLEITRNNPLHIRFVRPFADIVSSVFLTQKRLVSSSCTECEK